MTPATSRLPFILTRSGAGFVVQRLEPTRNVQRRRREPLSYHPVTRVEKTAQEALAAAFAKYLLGSDHTAAQHILTMRADEVWES